MAPPKREFARGYFSSRYSAIFQESRTTASPSRITGTVLPPEKAIAALSLIATGLILNSSPLCLSAMRVRQENRL